MNKRIRNVMKSLGLAALAILALAASSSYAEKGSALPQGDKILDKYVESTGGIKAYDKINNEVTKMSMDIPAYGVKIDIVVYSARPNKFYSKVTSPAIGSQERGTEGTVFWEKSTMAGSRILEGDELAEFKREATFERLAYWRTLFDKAECIGLDTVSGSPCYKVVLTDKGGKTTTLSIDRKTNLIAKTASVVATPQGNISIESIMSDYRKTGDLLVPFKDVMNVMGQERVMTTTSVEFNVAIPDSVFAVPGDIQELLKKK